MQFAAVNKLIFFILAVLSGGLSARLACRRLNFTEWIYLWAVSFAATMTAAGALAFKYGLSTYEIMLVFGFLSIVLLYLYFNNRKNFEREPLALNPAGLLLLLILAGSAVLRILLMWNTEFPLGDDSYFHCLYARSIQQAGRLIYSMAPYNPLPLKYPWGLHVMLAWASGMTGIPIHSVFKGALIAYSVVSVLGVFVAARRITGSYSAALWSAFLYGLVVNFGSIDYIRWGGLSNVFSMAALLALALLALKKDEGVRTGWMWPVFVLITAFLVHGSAAAVLYAVLASFAVVLFLRGGKGISDGLFHLVTIAVSIGAGAIVAPDIFSHLVNLGGVAGVFEEKYVGVMDFPLIFSIIPAAAAAAGFVILSRRPRQAHFPLFAWTLTLLAGFIASRYGAGLVNYIRSGSAICAFVPSRFVTDMAYPISIFAGAAFAWGFGKLGAVENRLLRWAVAAAVLALCLHIPFQHLHDKWGQTYAGPEEIRAMDWLAANAPQDSLIVNKTDAPGSYWVAYRSGRPTTITSFPQLFHLDFTNAERERNFVQAGMKLNHLVFQSRDWNLLGAALWYFPYSSIYVYSNGPIGVPWAKLAFRTKTIYIYQIKGGQ